MTRQPGTGVDHHPARTGRARTGYGHLPGIRFVVADAGSYLNAAEPGADLVLSVFGAFSFTEPLPSPIPTWACKPIPASPAQQRRRARLPPRIRVQDEPLLRHIQLPARMPDRAEHLTIRRDKGAVPPPPDRPLVSPRRFMSEVAGRRPS
jgi:hypothetical protein